MGKSRDKAMQIRLAHLQQVTMLLAMAAVVGAACASFLTVPAWALGSDASSRAGDLIEALGNPSPSQQAEAEKALRAMGSEVAPTLKRAAVDRDQTENVRRGAIYVVGQLKQIEATPWLIDLLADDAHHCVRMQAALALGAVHQPARRGRQAADDASWKAHEKQRDAAVDALVKALRDRERGVRESAIEAMAMVGRPAVPRLVAVINEADLEHRVQALRSLFAMKRDAADATPVLARLLRDDDYSVRREAAMALSQIGPAAKSARKPVLEALLANRDDIREFAGVALEGIGYDETSVKHLISMLREGTRAVKLEALEHFRRMGEQAAPAEPTLLKILSDGPSEFQPYAAMALWGLKPKDERWLPHLIKALEIGDLQQDACWRLGEYGPKAKAAVPGLVMVAQTTDGWARNGALWALGEIGKDAAAARPELLKLMASHDPEARAWSVDALAKIGPADDEQKQSIRALLKDAEWSVRVRAAGAAYVMGDPAERYMPLLVEGLKHEDWQVVTAAARTLKEIGPKAKQATPTLHGLIKNGPNWKQTHAAWALHFIEPDNEVSVPTLIAAMDDDEWWARADAAWMLGDIGPRAEAALPALRKRIDDRHSRVRHAVREAIEKITTKDRKQDTP